MGDQILPDPLSQKKGWISEGEGIRKWPSLYLTDISRFFHNSISSEDLIHRLECEYKEGKAYRYFTDEFVKEVPSSPFCIMKTKCTPSQRVSPKAYDVWAIIKKDTDEHPGGEVFSAYCSCAAGLLGSWNHVAGMLFRIEAAVITGITKPTCTSQLSEWVIPSKKTNVDPGKLSDFVIRKDHYRKKAAAPTKEIQLESAQKRLKFSPMSTKQEQYLQQASQVRDHFYQAIKGIVPGSCFSEFMEKSVLM